MQVRIQCIKKSLNVLVLQKWLKKLDEVWSKCSQLGNLCFVANSNIPKVIDNKKIRMQFKIAALFLSLESLKNSSEK